jgi:hypothetical protein
MDWMAEALGAAWEWLHLDRFRDRDEAKTDRRNFLPPR